MNLFYLGLAILPSILAIAILDQIMLKRWHTCPKCKYEFNWTYWILPTTLEAVCLIAGIIIGFGVVIK